MRNFILTLFTAILIEPCFAQMVGHNYHSGTAFYFQNMADRNFDKVTTLLEEAGMSVQIKTVPISNEQASLLMGVIEKQSAWSAIQMDYSNELIRDKMYVAGVGNGGGGTFYQVRAIGIQDSMLKSQSLQGQEVEFVAYNHKSQRIIEVDPYNSELTAWKISTPDKGHIAKDWKEIMFQAGLALPQVKTAKTELETIMLGNANLAYHKTAYFEDKAVQASLPTWFYSGEDIQTILQEIIEENEDGSIDDFYQMNVPAQNDFIYVVGPGNGGGGTYMIHRK